MNRHERLHAALSGSTVDRIPVSAWGHFFEKEYSAEDLAEAMLSFQDMYDWDFMKINCRGSYHAEVWGNTYTQSGKPGDRPVCISHTLHSINDWKKIKAINPKEGPLGEHLNAVELIRKNLNGKTPILMTIFSPLMIACFLYNLRSDFKNLPQTVNAIRQDLSKDPETVHTALAAIAETFANFCRELIKNGIDGIYFATNVASDSFFTEAEYQDLGRAYDLQVLQAVESLPFNVFHLCGDKVHLKASVDYPVSAIHWDTLGTGNPGLRNGKSKISQAVAGGVNRWTVSEGTPKDIHRQVQQAIAETEGKRFLLAPSCAISINDSPKANIQALRNAVHEI